MKVTMDRPGVGVGVWIRKNGKILLGKRLSEHAYGTWAPPGGKLDMNESWQQCARREVKEETGMRIKNIRYITATNNIYKSEGRHFVTLHVVADWAGGEARVMEPKKCAEWKWVKLNNMPKPLMSGSRSFLRNGYNPLKI